MHTPKVCVASWLMLTVHLFFLGLPFFFFFLLQSSLAASLKSSYLLRSPTRIYDSSILDKNHYFPPTNFSLHTHVRAHTQTHRHTHMTTKICLLAISLPQGFANQISGCINYYSYINMLNLPECNESEQRISIF